MTKEHRSQNLRRTMVKSTVGHVQRSTYDLPNDSHVYGYEIPRDPENAGQVISTWKQATPSPSATSGRSFIETNRQAISNGFLSAGETRKFANEHPDIVIRSALKSRRSSKPTNDTIHGVKSKESEDIWGLVQAKYTSYSNDNADYPDLSSMRARGILPMPRETRSSIGKDVRHYIKTPERHPSELFKMSKFKSVGSTLYTQPTPRHQKREESLNIKSAED
ncbi:putative cilia-and flagella-associated protein [Plasmopara halstedii]